jgi:GntR family transcriptional regulator
MNTRPGNRRSAAPEWRAGVPLYRQVREKLAGRIATGVWCPGVPLPGEPELARLFKVSISTVRAAVGELVQAGVLDRRQGRGTFVAHRGGEQSLYQFFHLHPDRGERHLPASELLSFASAQASDEEAYELKLGVGRSERQVFRLRNILLMGRDAVQISRVVLPRALFPGLTVRRIREGGTTLYGAYQSQYGVTVVRAEDAVRAVRLLAEDAHQFRLPVGTPALSIQRTAYTFGGVPVETRTSLLRSDHYHLRLRHGDPAP